MKITIDVDTKTADQLISLAYRRGTSYAREHPTKAWTDRERKQALQEVLPLLLASVLLR